MTLVSFLFAFLSFAWAEPDSPDSPEDSADVQPPDGESQDSSEGATEEPKSEDTLEATEPDAPAEGPTVDPLPQTTAPEAAGNEEDPSQESEDPLQTEQESSDEEEAPAPLSTEELQSAETAAKVDKSFFEFLKPSREKLPQNPYGNTQYTAYVLEFGQLRVGINQTALGIAPRVQLGTAPALDALGIYNGSGKIHVLHRDRIDLAIEGAYYTLDAGLNFDWLRGGAITSIQLTDPWSLHFGGSFDRLHIDGIPQLSRVSNLLIQDSADAFSEWQAQAEESGIGLEGNQSMATVRIATDYRFNRRDAIVLQGSAIVWSAADWGINGLDPESIPPVLNLDEILFDESSFQQSVKGSYTASLAYQRSRKHMDIRFGLGISAVQYAWLLQTFELSYNFGGETRREESKLKRNWRRNKRIDG